MLSTYLKALRINHELKISQRELASKLGVSNTSVSRYENGTKEPSLEILKKYADFFDVPYNELIAKKYFSEDENTNSILTIPVNVVQAKNKFKVPLYSEISAGLPCPISAQEPIEMIDFIADGISFTNQENVIALVVNGNSMNNIVPDKGRVFIDTKAEIKENDIVAFIIDGYDSSLKRFSETFEEYILTPDSNVDYPTLHVKKSDVSQREFNILGKLIDISTNHLI